MSNKQTITAVITDKRGRVISVGQNNYHRTHTMQAFHAKKVGVPEKIYIHAEVAAIVKCKDLSKAHKISVFRYNKQGLPMLAKPCIICMSCIEASGIKQIEFTRSGKC